jgi:NADPH:quinone reductase-like Zn-dependent oxidoreductase
MRTDAEALDDIAKLVKNGKMRIPIGRSFSLWNAAEAHEVQEKKQSHGKVVLFLE